MTPKTLGRVAMLAKGLSVVLVVHFQGKASSIYKQLRQCVSESGDLKMAELCQNYPESIDFHLKRRLDMVVDAVKAAAMATLFILAGCNAIQSATTLSERYRVCAKLPLSTSYRSAPPGPDFDLGTLKAEGLVVDVFIGGHPRFSHQVINKGVGATDGFKMLGRERSDEQDKVLFAYERGDEEGPIYVMFMAPNLDSVEPILRTEDLLVGCK